MKPLWSPAALDDLTDLYTFLAGESADAAERVVRAIVRAADGLTTFPAMGRAGAVPGTRERIMTRYPYKIVYRVRDGRVEIARVIHTARNWPHNV